MVQMGVQVVRKMTRISAIRHHRTNGFTLLELMLVLVILGMASVLVAPNFVSLESRSFNAQVRELGSLLNYARRTAVVKGQPTRATIRISADAAEETRQENSAPPARNGGDATWWSNGVEVSFTDSAEQRIQVEDVLEINFYPEGGSTGGEIILSGGNRSASFHIDPFSGRVSSAIDEN